jgi:hypothetical protein
MEIEIVNYRMLYLIPQGQWWNIKFLDVHAPTKYKDDEVKYNFCEELELSVNQFCIYHRTSLLWGFSTKVSWEEIIKPTVCEISIHNGVRFATSKKNLTVRNRSFPLHFIYKHTYSSPVGDFHIDHILVDRR